MIPGLIDKQDNVEVIRDQIAAILASEIASQQAYATADSKNPADWKLRVFSERSNPWEQFQSAPEDKSPLVNVWFDSETFDGQASNVMERQKTEAAFNIDCYGYGVSSDVEGGGHIAGDKQAALEVQKAIRLVRNILMAAEYTYLGLRGLVWQRMPLSITVFQPQLDAQNVQKIVGARLVLKVGFNEFSPQFEPSVLDYVSIDVLRAEDGEIVAEADYDYTAP